VKRRIVVATAALAAAWACSSLAWGAGSAAGTIIYLWQQADGVVQIEMSVPHTNPPPCGAGYAGWALNAATLAGQSMLATLLTGYSQGKTMHIVGTGACEVKGDTESIAGFYFN